MKGIAVFQNKLKGYVTFIQDNSKSILKINGNISNLSPGKHGFHIHKYGNLLKIDCTKCGGHFNPTNKVHGGRNVTNSHAGDLGNIIANEKGVAKFHFTVDKLSLYGKNSIFGRSIVVHTDPDDLGKGGFHDSLITGNSGGRLDCAVIGIQSE
jgi:superoxide dismutase, Cu-Zn family